MGDRYHDKSVWKNPIGRPRKHVINQNKTTTIRIDHDVSYSEYDTSYIKEWVKKIPYTILGMWIRRSTGNNTHVKLLIEGDLSPLDTLLIRAIMHDDARRIRGDLERYALDSPVFGLLFDEKYYPLTGEVHSARDWVEV